MKELIGQNIQGYKIIQILGRGGMGIVYRAYDNNLERYVAIKFLKSEIFDNPNIRERFKREAKNQAKLNHSNIVTVYGFLDYEGMLGIVMEFVEGTSLDKLIYQKRRLHINDALFLMKQVLTAVGYAHSKGFIHRDIKPSNIIVTQDGSAKIMDFGISKSVFDDNSVTRTGAKVGTPFYMSPEQIKGKDVTFHTDIYALGCTLFEIITGEPPFMGDSEYEVLEAHMKNEIPKITTKLSELPPAIDGIVAKALAKNPAERYKDCYEFKNDIVKYEKLKDFSPTGTQTVGKKGIKKYAPIFFIVGFLAILLIIMNFIYKQVDEFLKSDTLEEMEKYNVGNFFKSNKHINLESLTSIEIGTQANLHHINFVNENIGYIFGDSGLVLRTLDGKTWNKVKVVTSDSIDIINGRTILASEFFENGKAILVGQNGLAVKSENLLQNISKMELNTTASLFDVEFVNNQLGFIVGSKGEIYRTEDGGTSWFAIKSGTSDILYDIEFVSHNEGYIVGWNGTMLRTDDSGYRWEEIDKFTNKYLKSISFKSDKSGIAVGGTNAIFSTKDAGKTWTSEEIGNSVTLSRIRFITDDLVFAIGNRGVMLISENSGKTWQTVTSKIYYPLQDFTVTKSGNLFVVGSNGSLINFKSR